MAIDLRAVLDSLPAFPRLAGPRIRLRGFDDICRMAGAGVGIAVVPETAARRCRQG